MNRTVSGNTTIGRATELILTGFDDYNASFSDLSRRGKRRFEAGDRVGMRADVVARMALYDAAVEEVIARLEALLANRLFSRSMWKEMHRVYSRAIRGRLDAELYKTFFNTISRRLFKTRGVDPAIEFLALDIQPTDRITHPVSRHTYAVGSDLAEAFGRILDDYRFAIPYADEPGDAERLAARLAAEFEAVGEGIVVNVELLETVFYREGRAYIVGRAFGRQRYLPCVVALAQQDNTVRVDALLASRLQVSILFGYTFSYFLADLPTVGDAVVFLRTLLPDKPIDELYTVLGRAKQGKTERYRAFVRELLARPEETLVEADGQRGMVMAVFTLPSYALVFKLLRDRFAPVKTIRRHQVIERYHLVRRHDRVGRLLDVQEFRDLRFPRDQFSGDLLDELLHECARIVRVDGDTVIIRHSFVERRVRPLDLYLKEVDEEEARRVVLDMGQALKDLARSNIFAGDLLPKNFGVTRSGRVVFYDYDELMLLTECHFRHMPRAVDDFDHYSSETWFHVDDNDIFPEEFPRFLAMKKALVEVLEQHHGELFDADWWRDIQSRIRGGELLDVPPYTEAARLAG